MLKDEDIAMTNNVCKNYKKVYLKYEDINVSFKLRVKDLIIDGYPYPYLLCKLENGECVMIKRITHFIPNIPMDSSTPSEIVVMSQSPGDCTLICS